MKISYDPAKREWTLRVRGLDFLDAEQIFGGRKFTQIDDRLDYGEVRIQTYGLIKGRLAIVVWTQRGETRHIISLRKCNEREKAKVAHRLG